MIHEPIDMLDQPTDPPEATEHLELSCEEKRQRDVDELAHDEEFYYIPAPLLEGLTKSIEALSKSTDKINRFLVDSIIDGDNPVKK